MSSVEHATSKRRQWQGPIVGVLALVTIGGCAQRGQPKSDGAAADPDADGIQARNTLNSDCITSASGDACFSCRRRPVRQL